MAPALSGVGVPVNGGGGVTGGNDDPPVPAVVPEPPPEPVVLPVPLPEPLGPEGPPPTVAVHDITAAEARSAKTVFTDRDIIRDFIWASRWFGLAPISL